MQVSHRAVALAAAAQEPRQRTCSRKTLYVWAAARGVAPPPVPALSASEGARVICTMVHSHDTLSRRVGLQFCLGISEVAQP